MEYFVIAIEQCSTCRGVGYVEHPAWVAYFREHVDIDDTVILWFKERGYALPPHQEVQCSECGGTGVVETRVPLKQALREITGGEK